MSEDRLLALTEEIYNAAADGGSWSDVGRSLSRLVEAHTGWLVISDPVRRSSEVLYSADWQADDIATYQTHYRSLDLWTNRVAALVTRVGPDARPKTRISGHLVPDAEYTSSEFYTDFGKRVGLRHVIGTILPLGAAGLMAIGLHRPDNDPPFEVADAQLLDYLLLHLRRAVQIRHRLVPVSSLAAPGVAALDALSTAVMVVDAEMRLLLANAAAEAIANAGSAGIRITRRTLAGHGSQVTVTALHREDNAALGTLVKATALGGSSGGALRIRNQSLTPATAALVTPLPRRLSNEALGELSGRVAGQTLLLLRDLLSPLAPPNPDMLRNLFGLTPAEAEVARAICGGVTKSSVAASRGLRESTVRTQVRSILAKTGTTNLRDLERLLATLR
jgi:DNA-binding CsgD family transcriptional regulator